MIATAKQTKHESEFSLAKESQGTAECLEGGRYHTFEFVLGIRVPLLDKLLTLSYRRSESEIEGLGAWHETGRKVSGSPKIPIRFLYSSE